MNRPDTAPSGSPPEYLVDREKHETIVAARGRVRERRAPLLLLAAMVSAALHAAVFLGFDRRTQTLRTPASPRSVRFEHALPREESKAEIATSDEPLAAEPPPSTRRSASIDETTPPPPLPPPAYRPPSPTPTASRPPTEQRVAAMPEAAAIMLRESLIVEVQPDDLRVAEIPTLAEPIATQTFVVAVQAVALPEAVPSEVDESLPLQTFVVAVHVDDSVEAETGEGAGGGATPSGLTEAEALGAAGVTGEVFNVADVDRPPVATMQIPPRLPAKVRREAANGVVVVRFIVTATGRVVGAVVVSSSHPGLEAPTLAAIARWEFIAGRKGGNRVHTRVQQEVRFMVSSSPFSL